MPLSSYRTRERAAAPAWILLLPAAAGLIAWLMTKKKTPPSPPSSSTSSSSSTSTPSSSSAPAPGSSLPKAKWTTPYKGRHFEPLFLAATAKYGLPAGLLSRQAQRESGYDPVARSPAGALGIMQIIPKWHPEVGESGALDPTKAIPYAARYLRQLYDRFGSWTLALAAYNAGPGVVARYGGVPPYAETRAYVAAILPDVGINETGIRYA